MAILSITPLEVGTTGVVPSIIKISTSNTIAEVTTSGFLDSSKSEGYTYSNLQMALVSTQNAGVYTTGWYSVSVNSSTHSVTLTAS